MSHTYLPLPSQPKMVLIYRPRRDGRLSWPWLLVGWLHTEISVWHRELNSDTVAHLGTNRARRRYGALGLRTGFLSSLCRVRGNVRKASRVEMSMHPHCVLPAVSPVPRGAVQNKAWFRSGQSVVTVVNEWSGDLVKRVNWLWTAAVKRLRQQYLALMTLSTSHPAAGLHAADYRLKRTAGSRRKCLAGEARQKVDDLF